LDGVASLGGGKFNIYGAAANMMENLEEGYDNTILNLVSNEQDYYEGRYYGDIALTLIGAHTAANGAVTLAVGGIGIVGGGMLSATGIGEVIGAPTMVVSAKVAAAGAAATVYGAAVTIGSMNEAKIHFAKSKDSSSGKGKLKYKLKSQDLDWRGSGKTYKDALDEAFNQTGLLKEEFKVTQWRKDINGKSFSVEWRAENGAEVSIDYAHYNVDNNGNWITGSDAPHVGWQTGGKRSGGGAVRGHILLDEVPYGR